MRKRLISIVIFLLILPTPSSHAALVSASAGETVCNQTVDNSAGVTAYRLAESYCVVEFRSVTSTVWTLPNGVTSIEYLVVAGGGGGAGGIATAHGGGGGGAGGVRTGTLSVTSSTLNVSIGAGGSGGLGSSPGVNGGDSSLGGSITSIGGGGGGTYYTYGPIDGGSGGGAGASGSLTNGANGTLGQGNDGGDVCCDGRLPRLHLCSSPVLQPVLRWWVAQA